MKKLFSLALAILVMMALVSPAFASVWGDVRGMAVQKALVSARVPTTAGSSGATQLTAQHAIISSISVISESTAGYVIGVYNSNNTGSAGNEAANTCIFEAEVPGTASTSNRLNYYDFTNMPLDCPNGIVIMMSDGGITGDIVIDQPAGT